MYHILILKATNKDTLATNSLLDSVTKVFDRHTEYLRYDVKSIDCNLSLPVALSLSTDENQYNGAVVIASASTENDKLLLSEVYRACADVGVFNTLPLGFAIYNKPLRETDAEILNKIGTRAAITCLQLVDITLEDFEDADDIDDDNINLDN